MANPGIPRVKSMAKMEHALTTSPEAAFRTFQLGQWAGQTGAWLPWVAWNQLERIAAPEPGARVVLGFDGGESGDSTALCWATREAVGVVEVWENIEPGWRVDHAAVVESILAAFQRWDVRMLACDPAGWRSEIETIEREVGNRVHRVRFSQYAEFAPACDRFYQAIMTGQLAWDGSRVLSRHLGNAVSQPTRSGTAIRKAYLQSTDHIDAGVAAILAYEWASRTMQPQGPLGRVVW